MSYKEFIQEQNKKAAGIVTELHAKLSGELEPIERSELNKLLVEMSNYHVTTSRCLTRIQQSEMRDDKEVYH